MVNDDLTDVLKTHLNKNCVSHAYIFNNAAQEDFENIVKWFALSLLCLNTDGNKPCNNCVSCRMMAVGTHPDCFWVGTKEDYNIDPEEKIIEVDRVRKLLESMYERPLYSERKICYVERAERMNIQAQNCLLKLFEEPPEGSVIVLGTTNKHMLLETLRSRAVIIEYEAKDEGSSLESKTQGEVEGTVEAALKIVLELPGCSGTKLVEFSRYFETFKDKKNAIIDIIKIAGIFYRDMMVYNLTNDESMLINEDSKSIIKNNANRFKAEDLAAYIAALEQTRSELVRQFNFQLVIDSLLMNISNINSVIK